MNPKGGRSRRDPLRTLAFQAGTSLVQRELPLGWVARQASPGHQEPFAGKTCRAGSRLKADVQLEGETAFNSPKFWVVC